MIWTQLRWPQARFQGTGPNIRSGVGHRRLLVGAVSLVLRVGLGLVFFGSIDLLNSVCGSRILLAGRQLGSRILLAGRQLDLLPYFPVVPALIWLGGVLSVRTALPVAFCFKLVPILFDSLLALLIYDVLVRRSPAVAFRAALLYATSPIALLITCIHAQWEPICLFFLMLALNLVDDPAPGRHLRLLAGACFALSFLVKPLTVVCFPFLFPPLLPTEGRRRRLHESFDTALGMEVFVAASFVLFWLFGYDLLFLLLRIWFHAFQGVQIFGLPFAFQFNGPILLRSRIWIPLVLAWLAVAYHRGKVGRFEAALFSLSLPLGVAGIAPQYLLWPVPYLLVTRMFRLGALYNLVTVAFLVVYYMMPSASYIPNENMGAFAALRGFSWLMPPQAIGAGLPARLLHFVGNLVIPVCALTIAARAAGLRGKADAHADRAEEPSGCPAPAYSLYLTTLAAVVGSLALLYATEDRAALRAESDPALKAKLAQYDMEIIGDPDSGWDLMGAIGHYPRVSYINTTN